MPSAWINYVKCYQNQHNCSYKEALKGASETYKCSHIEGGKLNMKPVKQIVKQVVNGDLNLSRKAKNTVQTVKRQSKKVSKLLDAAAPALSMIDPELAVSASVVSNGIKKGNKMTGGKLGSKKNPYLSGGSFLMPQENFGGGCASCSGNGGMGKGTVNDPLKKKSYKKSIVEN